MFSRLTVITAFRAQGADICCTKPSKPKRVSRQSWPQCQQKITKAIKILLLSCSWLPTVQQLQRKGGETGRFYNLRAYRFGTNNFKEKWKKKASTLNIQSSPCPHHFKRNEEKCRKMAWPFTDTKFLYQLKDQ